MKKLAYIKNVDLFPLIQSLLITFDIKFIYFDITNFLIQSGDDLNQFRCDDLKSGFKFGFKKLIKHGLKVDLITI